MSDWQTGFDGDDMGVQGLHERIEELEKLATQRGARMQIMREFIVHRDMWDGYFNYLHDDADSWFDADGVPVREEK